VSLPGALQASWPARYQPLKAHTQSSSDPVTPFVCCGNTHSQAAKPTALYLDPACSFGQHTNSTKQGSSEGWASTIPAS